MSKLQQCIKIFSLVFMLLMPGLSQAQDASGSAFGESVDLSIKSSLSLVTVEAQSGPLPMVSHATPPPYSASDDLPSVDINANLKLLGLLPAVAVGILETGLLEVSTTGENSPQSDSSASVANVNLELLGIPNLPLLPAIPIILGLDAEAVSSTASAGGSCDSGLNTSGTTTLVGASVFSDLGDLLGIDAGLLANPPPNFVLLEVNLFGGHVSVVLNEQIITGDGVTSRGITVNAIHVSIDQLPLAELLTDVTGDVIIAQSKAEVTCSEADIAVTITDSPDPVVAGENLVYTLVVSNSGPDTATSVMLEQLLPAGVTYVSAVPDQGSCAEDSGTVSCDLGDLASSTSTTITVTVTPTAPGSINTSASVSSEAHDPNLNDNEDEEGTTVNPAPGSADLGITLTDLPDPINAGQALTVTLDVINNGPDSAENAVVQYTLPPGITPDSVTPSVGSCNFSPTTVTCNLGTLASGATPDIVIVMTPPIPATLQHTATVSSGTNDPTPGNNIANGDTTVQVVPGADADLSLDKADSPDPVIVGQPLTYTLTITNNGPNAANTVFVSDTLPGSVTFQSANASQGSCNHSAGTVSCNLGSMLLDAVETVTIVVIPQEVGQLSNTAVVSSDVNDPDTDDNSDMEDSTVNPGSADLSITKTASVNPALVGDEFQYTLAVFNNGPNDATQVVVTDDLPASLDFVSAIPSQGNCNEENNLVTCQLGSVTDQGNATVVITVAPTEAGGLTNTAVVDSQLDDPIPDDNEVDEDTEVDPRRADLGLSKTASMSPAFVDVPFEYTLTVFNDGPQEATLVELEDVLPDSLVIGAINTSQGSCNPAVNTVTCELGTINPQDSVVVTIEVTPTELGTLNNTAVVDAETEDPDPSDNTATHTNQVATGRATFAVSKIFNDENPGPVQVSIDCNTGLILDQDKLISPEQGVIFIVTQYSSGELTCTITEDVPAGYAPQYDDGSTSSSESCVFEAIESNQDFTCVITNTVQAVTIAIEKQWIYEGSSQAIDEGYKLLVECEGEIVGGESSCGHGQDRPLGDIDETYSCLILSGHGDAEFPVQVIPDYPSSDCQVREFPNDSAVEIENGCQQLTVKAGQGDSCLITNTVYFEGIPVLDSRGMLLLSLLLLGMGMVAFRKMSA